MNSQTKPPRQAVGVDDIDQQETNKMPSGSQKAVEHRSLVPNQKNLIGNPTTKISNKSQTRGQTPPRCPSSARSTISISTLGEEETQISESSSVQTQQTGTSSRLLIHEGIAHHKRGNYPKALQSFRFALKSTIITNSDHPFLANTLANIGSTYLRQGLHAPASATLQQAMQMMKRLREQCKSDKEKSKIYLSGVLNNLGTVQYLRGDSKTSLEYYREALKDAKLYGGSKKEIANASHNIGRLLVLESNWDAAMSTLKESLEVEKFLYGENSMEVVDTLNLIGFVHFSTTAFDAATVVFADALSIVHENCGLVHEKVGNSLLNVGMVMERQGRLDEALHTFTTAREVFERVGLTDDDRSFCVATKSIDDIRQLLNSESSNRFPSRDKAAAKPTSGQEDSNLLRGQEREFSANSLATPWMGNKMQFKEMQAIYQKDDAEEPEYREDQNWEADHSDIVDARDSSSTES